MVFQKVRDRISNANLHQEANKRESERFPVKEGTTSVLQDFAALKVIGEGP